ncbi:hypothetical protein [Novosphingobium sp. SG707]|uniref:hypothetical protein n=1 Tax=Novosphingobium sp. SG707 TaxID=2586996 RepID=UPI0014479F7E|nr:hypothetical protein [Novosphingobium sp. SG707]NKI98094.1 hypothetical protein [Novosphingobium sp. SG707]
MLTLQIVALFNLIFGFFWSSALVENLSGKAADDVGLRTIQKGILGILEMGQTTILGRVGSP